ncbi:MAG TPA: glycosyltransferase [Candidatus Nitrosopolaris sp.]|nr:glycosyltransferase [Candidatus Nitrosopolaris sp.]
MTRPDISVVIPTYQREKELVNTMRNILSQSHKNLELIVLDQSRGHKPETAKALRAIRDPRFRLIKIGPPSLPAARNFGLAAAKAPIVLFLDDDIKAVKNLVKCHLEAHQKHPEVSAVGGRVLQDGFPVKKEVLRFDKHGVSHGVFTASQAGFTNAFPGGNHSIRISDALALGGYDTRYYRIAFREESDMSLKMIRAGMKIYYEPKAEIYHLNTVGGGLRHYDNLFDTLDFYRNDLFFVMHCVGLKNIPGALHAKFMEYCHIRPLSKGLKRSLYFVIGFLTALRRLWFGRQIVAKETAG